VQPAKNTPLGGNYLLDCRGKLLDLHTPRVAGILNITEDSFYAGSRVHTDQQILKAAGTMLSEGASILDLGGQSSRPGALPVGEAEEREKVLRAIQIILEHFPDALVSVDTYSSGVAAAAIRAGASLINDISAGRLDPDMIPLAGSLGVPYIAMHMQGEPANMQEHPHYEDVVREVLDFFIHKAFECASAGISDLILDPGFGFGKSLEHNYTLLQHLDVFSMTGRPLMIGISRKSMVYKPAGSGPQDALLGTTALHMLALEKGVSLLRVHDVKPALEAIRLFGFYQQQR